MQYQQAALGIGRQIGHQETSVGQLEQQLLRLQPVIAAAAATAICRQQDTGVTGRGVTIAATGRVSEELNRPLTNQGIRESLGTW